jgi:hypothetical protein
MKIDIEVHEVRGVDSDKQRQAFSAARVDAKRVSVNVMDAYYTLEEWDELAECISAAIGLVTKDDLRA